jgi:hypothetical protein
MSQELHTDNNTFDGNGTDDSIIDITGQSTAIIYGRGDSGVVRYPPGVPAWKHQYIYSARELDAATSEQTDFYHHFKKCFLLHTALDLEGSTNYAFILLFDLLADFKSHHELSKLEKQLLSLAVNYPKTRPYGLSMLSLAMEEAGDVTGIERIRDFQQNPAGDYSLKLGDKFRKKLLLKDREVELLNRIWYPDNNFCSMDFCLLETVKLYLLVIDALDHRYKKEGTVAAVEYNTLADFITMRKIGNAINDYNYKYTILSSLNDIYTLIFRYAENALREAYGHTRKLNTELHDKDTEIAELYEQKLLCKLRLLLPVWVLRVEQPDETTEIALFSRNTARWKTNFELITKEHGHDPDKFYQDIRELARLNRQNPSVEMIWFEAARFIAKQDKITSLRLYIQYIYQDLNSETFDNRKLNKTIQKSLFSNTTQLEEFEAIITELVMAKDLDKAIDAVTRLYQPKRKKITLDRNAISEISEKHSGTVDLLNRYLEDETEVFITQPLPDEEIVIKINSPEPAAQVKIYVDTLAFTEVQLEILNLFRKANLTLPIVELEAFAKEHGVFKNQLVDRINELCYELLDDILIEEEEDNYIINEDYYQHILIR